MTRTQKLGLCTWLPEDPVCLAEVNDNFTRLDASGGRALRLAEAAMVNLGGLMAVRAHNGGRPAYADGMIIDAFQDSSLLESYSGGLLFLNKRLELAPVSPTSATVNFGGEKGFHASNLTQQISKTKEWVDIFTFRPNGYCAATQLTLKTGSSTSTGTPAHMKLSIWRGKTMLCQTSMGAINHYSDRTESPASYTINQPLDPNVTYTMKLWIEDMTMPTGTISYVKFDVAPSAFSAGTAVCAPLAVSEAQQADILVHATIAEPTVAVRFSETGDFTPLTPLRTQDETLPDGTVCKLLRYRANVPEGAQSAQVQLSVNGSSCVIYDYVMILL